MRTQSRRPKNLACAAVCALALAACGGASGNNSGTDGGNTSTGITWAGTWNASLTYTVNCDVGFGNMKQGNETQSLTIQLSGANSSLTGTPQTPTSGWTPMTGTGSATGMTLSGQFPFEDNTGTPVTFTNNSSTIKITSVESSSSASGTFTGSGQDQFGDMCTVSGGMFTLSR